MEPLVSVLIPVFNVLPYLREALDSVLSQTYSNLEILIVDDGSTDGSGEICDEYCKDPRVRVIHQENQGLSAARNAGLDRMTGDVVAFLDSDDAFFPDAIQTMLSAMQRHSADIVTGGYVQCDTQQRVDTRQNPGQSITFHREQWMTAQEALAALLEGHIRHYVWDKLYIRKIWVGMRFPKGQLFEDISTTYRVINKSGCVLTVTGHQIMHRIRPNSISQTNTAKNIQARMDAFANMEQFL